MDAALAISDIARHGRPDRPDRPLPAPPGSAIACAPVAATLQRLGAVVPTAAVQAEALLARLFAPLAASVWPDMAWRFSDLTNTGCPLEFAWSSREAAVRWTAEVAPGETEHPARLAHAGALLDWPVQALADWQALQSGHRLKFGAWASARHAEDGTRASKLYVELPGGALPPGWPQRHPLLRSRLLRWRMAGVNPDGGVELYARAAELDRRALRGLAEAVLGDAAPLEARLDALLPTPEPPRPSGLSLALSPSGQPRALTWFCFAKAIFDDDAAVAARLRGLGEGRSAEVYAALAEGPADGRWRHGMVGAGADIGGQAWVQCGVRPT